MNVKKRRRLSNFEACSVALFAALTITGGSSAARAQNTATAARTMNTAHRAVVDRNSPTNPRILPARAGQSGK